MRAVVRSTTGGTTTNGGQGAGGSWSPLCGARFPPRATRAPDCRLARVVNRCAMGREAQLMCWALEAIMRTQPRQQLRFQALLAERAQFMRHHLTDTEQALWRQLSGSKPGVAFRRQGRAAKMLRGRAGKCTSRIEEKIAADAGEY